MTKAERVEQFVGLFHEGVDQLIARRWAMEHMPAQDAPRETTTEFFNGVIDLVKSSGFWPNQSTLAICEPVKPYWPPKMAISHPGFKFLSKLEVDHCNQLYIACYLCDFIDGEVDRELLIGTIISMCRNRDVCLAMGSLTGDALFQAVYDIVQTAHPYDKFLKQVGYYGRCEERSKFYASRDERHQFQRSRPFLKLFNDWDREQARLWLEKNFPPEKPTEVLRDTGGSLFSSVVRMAKVSGDFDRAGAILDYYLPCEHKSGTRERVELTAYEFDFVPIANYGCEGIYIDCYLKGKFDESGRYSLHVGTLKTLKRDLESAKIMGELCGTLMHHASGYVNQNLRRYMSAGELEAAYQRKQEQIGKEDDDG